jgi:ankyrin repeat protein
VDFVLYDSLSVKIRKIHTTQYKNMKSLITKLSYFLNKGDKIKVEAAIEEIAESIEAAVKEELFFSLPTNEIVKIIQKSGTSNAETCSNIIIKMCEAKGGEAALVLNVIEPKEATFNECVKIVSSLNCSPICVKLGDLYTEDDKLPERDYEHEIEELKKEIEKLKKKKETNFKPVTKKPFFFESDIYKAVAEGKLTSVQYLIEQSHVNVEAKDKNGRTPLHIASEKGQIEVVKYLIEQSHANVEAKDKNERTPLHIASENDHIKVAQYLVEQCHANVEAEENEFGITPLHIASEKGHIKIVKYLVEQCRANTEAKDYLGFIPLHSASRNGQIKVVKYFIEQCHIKADVKSLYGRTPLHNAASSGYIEVAKYLIEQHHVNADAKDEYGQTPLHVASIMGNIDVVKYLVEQCRVNVGVKDNEGNTPFQVASPINGTEEYLQSISGYRARKTMYRM